MVTVLSRPLLDVGAGRDERESTGTWGTSRADGEVGELSSAVAAGDEEAAGGD